MGIEAYRHTQATAEAPRAQEYHHLASLTLALQQAEEGKDIHIRALAIIENQKFWAGLRLAAVSAVNSLPAESRARLVTLADWVERESALASLGDAPLEGLIAVNRQIMEGLRPYTGSLTGDSLKPSAS